MSECQRCGEREAVPGQLGTRCRRCIKKLVDRHQRTAPETTIVLKTATGPARRLRIREANESGAPFALEEDTWTGCAWRPIGRELLERVELDGEVYAGSGGVLPEP